MAEAIRRALAHNFTVRGAAYAPRIAEAIVQQNLGVFDPALQGSFRRTENTFPATAQTVSGADTRIGRDSGELALAGLVPWGLTYRVGGAVERGFGTLASPDDDYATSAGVSLVQPLLRGAGFGATLAGVRLARTDLALSETDFEQAVIDTVTLVIATYQNVYFAQENLRIARNSRELAAVLLRENERRVEIGSMAPADVLVARARVARQDESILAAERALRDAQNRLRLLLGDDVRRTADQPLAVTPPEVPVMPLLDKPGDLMRAFDRRPDWRGAQLAVQRGEIVVKASRHLALPQLDLVASLGYDGYGDRFRTSARDVRTRDHETWSAGAILHLPLPLREGRGRARAARLSLERTQLDLQRLEQDIVVAVANAAGQVETAAQRVDAARRARQFAQESLDAQQKRLNAGQSDTFTVLQFQDILADASVREFRAIADYNIALANYDRETATTLTRLGLKVE
jgi:outer membrane protein